MVSRYMFMATEVLVFLMLPAMLVVVACQWRLLVGICLDWGWRGVVAVLAGRGRENMELIGCDLLLLGRRGYQCWWLCWRFDGLLCIRDAVVYLNPTFWILDYGIFRAVIVDSLVFRRLHDGCLDSLDALLSIIVFRIFSPWSRFGSFLSLWMVFWRSGLWMLRVWGAYHS